MEKINSVKDLDNFNRIIYYNDDIHGTLIFLNGDFLGTLEDCHIVQKIIQTTKTIDDYPFIEKEIDIMQLYDIVEEEELAEYIHYSIFQQEQLTPEQEFAIITDNFLSL